MLLPAFSNYSSGSFTCYLKMLHDIFRELSKPLVEENTMLQLLKLDIEDVENENVVKSVKKVLNNMNAANRSETTKLRGADKKFPFLWDLV